MARTTGNISGPQPKLPQKDLKLATGARDEVLKAARLSADRLGPKAKELSKALVEEFAKAGGHPSDEALADALSRLREAAKEDGAVKLRTRLPRLPTGNAAKIPKRLSNGEFFQESGGKLVLHATLAAPEHGVGKLLKNLGIDPKDLPQNVADMLREALGSNKSDTLEKKTWNDLVQVLPRYSPKLAEASTSAVEQTSKVAQTQKTTSAPAPTPNEPMGEAPTRNQGLEATAPESTGTGNKNNAIALLARNLSQFNKAKSGSAEHAKLATKIADAFAEQAEASGGKKLTAEERKKIELVLHKVLEADSTAPGGELRITGVAANAFRELAAIKEAQSGGDAGVVGIAAQITSAMDKALSAANPAKVDEILAREPGKKKLADSLDELAGFALGNLINAELGRPVEEPNSDLLGKMTGLLGNLGGPEAKKVAKQLNAELRPGSPAARALEKGKAKLEAGAQAQITPELRKSAEAELARIAQMGPPESPLRSLDPKSPEGKRVVGALAQIIGGAKNDKEIIAKAADYFREQTGIPHPRLESVKALLASGIGAGGEGEAERVAMMKADALTQITLFAANPEQYLAALQPHLDLAATRTPDSFDPFKVDVGQLRTGAPHQFGIAGITGSGNPRDAGSQRAQLYAQRSAVISMVLNDPCLSIEDKIFLFMMWFAAFADEERKIKMEELAELDRMDAEKHQLLQRNQDGLKNVQERSGQLQVEHEKAEKALTDAKAGGDPDAIKKAEAAVVASGKRVVENDNKRQQLEGDIDRLQRETQEAPKSREILLFELDRITQLRGNIMDMAKHFLEDSHRRIKEIMR